MNTSLHGQLKIKITRDCITSIAAGGVIGVPECFAYCSFRVPAVIPGDIQREKRGEKRAKLLAS